MSSWLKRIERFVEPFAVPNLTLYFVIGQAFVYLGRLLGLIPLEILQRLDLYTPAVLRGEAWRLVTFLFIPPGAHWALIAFALYFLYLMGSALESYWGKTRYNLFILTGFVLTVAATFISHAFYGVGYGRNEFIGGAIFLAFAYLHPDFVIYLFFVLPVKIRWVAIVTWCIYGYTFLTGTNSTRLLIAAGVGNFLIFFARDIWLDVRQGRRRMKAQAGRRAEEKEAAENPRFQCLACGRDSNNNPELDFRYCSKCAGECCYCQDHIRDHPHVVEAQK